jgi:hypothetical protein
MRIVGKPASSCMECPPLGLLSRALIFGIWSMILGELEIRNTPAGT